MQRLHFSKLFLVIAACFTLLEVSCHKDPSVVKGEVIDQNPGSTINVGDTIVLGDGQNMFVKYFNDTASPQCVNCNVDFPFDVNNDGVDDFSFYGYVAQSPGCGTAFHSELRSVNVNAQFNGITQTDTSFLHEEVLSSYTDTAPPYYVHINLKQTYTYHSLSSTDKILKIYPGTLHFIPGSKGDSMYGSQIFKVDSVPLNIDPCYWGPQMYTSNDTVYYVQHQQKADQFTFPHNIVYVGFKLLDGKGGYKLGWLKICSPNDCSLILYESGIQK